MHIEITDNKHEPTELDLTLTVVETLSQDKEVDQTIEESSDDADDIDSTNVCESCNKNAQ